MKEIKVDLSKWRDILCVWFGKFGFVKGVNSPKTDLKSQLNSNKIPTKFFVEINKLNKIKFI